MVEQVEEEERAEATARGPSPVATWVRVCRLGAVTAVVWSIALQLEIGALVPDIAAIGAVFGILTLFLTGERRTLAIATGAVALVAIVANLSATIDVLGHPSSGVAFARTVLSMLAATVSVVAGLAIVTRWSVSAARPVVISAAVILAGAVIMGAVASASVTSGGYQDGDVAVVAERNEFDQTELVVPAGVAGFWLNNRDGIRHTLTVAETGDEIDAPGYSAQRADFALEPGSYTMICAVPGHEHMRIDLAVAASP